MNEYDKLLNECYELLEENSAVVKRKMRSIRLLMKDYREKKEDITKKISVLEGNLNAVNDDGKDEIKDEISKLKDRYEFYDTELKKVSDKVVFESSDADSLLIECYELLNEAAIPSGREKFFEEHGIEPKSAIIGFSEKEQKWYGWSHRAIYGFGIGDVIDKKNVVCSKFGTGTVKPGFKCKTLDDCKFVAEEFAKSVD